MIPVAKGHIYSYRDFTPEDLKVQPEETEEIFIEDLRKLDSINYMDLTSAEYWEFIAHQWKLFKKDLKHEYRYRNKYFLKEFCISVPDPDCDVNEFINKYTLSDWNQTTKDKHIDDRTLKIELFSYVDRVDSLFAGDVYLVKVEHIYQLILDLSRRIECADQAIRNGWGDRLVSNQEFNLYVFPVYILNFKAERYFRISEICYGKCTINEFYDLIFALHEALKAFVATNFYMLDLYESNNKVSVYNENKRMFNNVTFKAYATTATSNKKVYSYIEKNMPDKYSPSIEINIDPDRENVLAGNVIPRKLCDYRFTVRGHYTHVWKGKRGNQRREKVWVDAYEKNKEKPFKIIKETKLK